MLDMADSTFEDASSSFPNAFTTLIPPSCSSTSVVICASASFTLKETPIAFAEKLDASHNTAGIESRTIDPSGKLRLKRVILNMISNKMLAVANGAIANASLT